MTASRIGLKHYVAASLMEAGMFACMASALVSWSRDAPLLLTLAPILPAAVLGFLAVRRLRTVRRVFDEADGLHAVDGNDSGSRLAIAAATAVFFVTTLAATFAFTLLLVYSLPALRPDDDFLAVSLLLSTSVSYAILMSSFFVGLVGPFTASGRL